MGFFLLAFPLHDDLLTFQKTYTEPEVWQPTPNLHALIRQRPIALNELVWLKMGISEELCREHRLYGFHVSKAGWKQPEGKLEIQSK